MTASFSIKRRLKSFQYAAKGIAHLVASQHNAWIHLVATVLVVCFGFYCQLSASDWSLIVVAITMVWTTEAINTAIELLCDFATSDRHSLIEKTKDLAAGAVLIAAIGAAAIAILVFYPYL
ncbi:MAG: diacylglycerol kinase [Deltaproteobacteria bacterium CG11_big_fil_rev_8_21_14_0_20_47_16]|nr:MAG: diacylglycerol kinase [Deltaproteobacteria bacterium CG11_big_fil_rev_8_21_14_0_20_47_16]